MSRANGKGSARAWQRMLSGRRLDLLDPSPLDIEIEDIAHGLARVARWNGQTKGEHAFSVAEHCLLVEAIAGTLDPKLQRRMRLAALIHDAPEYVIGDLISPFKAALSLDYRAFEAKLLAAIHLRFGLPVELPPRIATLIPSWHAPHPSSSARIPSTSPRAWMSSSNASKTPHPSRSQRLS